MARYSGAEAYVGIGQGLLTAILAARASAIVPGPETAAFLSEGRPPARFVSTNHFAEYDQRYR